MVGRKGSWGHLEPAVCCREWASHRASQLCNFYCCHRAIVIQNIIVLPRQSSCALFVHSSFTTHWSALSCLRQLRSCVMSRCDRFLLSALMSSPTISTHPILLDIRIHLEHAHWLIEVHRQAFHETASRTGRLWRPTVVAGHLGSQCDCRCRVPRPFIPCHVRATRHDDVQG